MNVLINQEHYINDSVVEYLDIAEDVKVRLVDAYFENKVGIDNVEAGFKVFEDAKDLAEYVRSVKVGIYNEEENSIHLIRCLKAAICVARQRIDALNRVLESL